jgi:hypothetical protein
MARAASARLGTAASAPFGRGPRRCWARRSLAPPEVASAGTHPGLTRLRRAVPPSARSATVRLPESGSGIGHRASGIRHPYPSHDTVLQVPPQDGSTASPFCTSAPSSVARDFGRPRPWARVDRGLDASKKCLHPLDMARYIHHQMPAPSRGYIGGVQGHNATMTRKTQTL